MAKEMTYGEAAIVLAEIVDELQIEPETRQGQAFLIAMKLLEEMEGKAYRKNK